MPRCRLPRAAPSQHDPALRAVIQGLSGDAVRELRRLRFLLRLVTRFRPRPQQAMLWWAMLVGIFGAGAALAFQEATHGLQWMLTGGHTGGQVAVFRDLTDWQRVAVPAIGGLCAGLMVMLASRVIRHKTQDYMEAVALGDGEVRARSSLMRSGAALFSIASGASIGREGPLVQLAAMAASVTGRVLRMPPARMRLLVACGAASGIAAAYNAPIAGALFVAEIVLGSIAMESLGPLIISSAVGALVVRLATGDAPLYGFAAFKLSHPWELLLFAVLGVCCAVAARLFLWALRGGRLAFARVPGPAWLHLTLGGLAVGLLALRFPEVAGNGHAVISDLLDGRIEPQAVPLLLFVKVAAVALVFGSGAVGGVFTPSLFTGAAIGCLFGSGLAVLLPDADIHASGYTIVGMGALLAAASQAPVTAILMIFEMSLQYEIMLPLMIAVVTAHATARALRSETLYAAILAAGPRSVFDKPLAQITAGDMMRPHPTTVLPAAKFREVARELVRRPTRELFVATADHHYDGAILLADVRPYLRDAELADVVVARDIAREDIPVIVQDTGITETMGIFTRSPHEQLPVIDGPEGRLVGSLARADVFLAVSELARREHLRSDGQS